MKSPHDEYYRFKTKHNQYINNMLSLYSKLARQFSGAMK